MADAYIDDFIELVELHSGNTPPDSFDFYYDDLQLVVDEIRRLRAVAEAAREWVAAKDETMTGIFSNPSQAHVDRLDDAFLSLVASVRALDGDE